jgi:pyruvate carboxylase subunit B
MDWNKMAKKPLKITDTTFRDGHQSSLATRMRTEDMVPVAKELDDVGFHSVEVWGGATFDVTHRFLGEDPWERVRTLKKLMPKTPFQMLLRGQNLVAYRNHPDDLVEAFVEKSAEVGIDIFRCFDAVNDERNFETAFKVIKRMKKHIQGTICYSLTQRRMGGPVFNLGYYLQKAKILVEMGSDSLCIKDMAGILAPYDVYDLVKALKESLKIPIQLHTHYTSGMGSMTYLKAVEAGVDVIDTALAPFALRSSQPAVEPIVVTLEGTPWDTGLDLAKLLKLGEYLETIAPKYRDFLDTTKMAVIDTSVLKHQIPGGMISNMVSQLKQQKAVHRLEEVYVELPKTREDLGTPPLVTPTSQIIGVQAVLNVLFGRYKMVSRETQDLAYGLYGRTPVPIKENIRKQVLKGYAKGQEPITCRPADLIPSELEKAKEETKGLAKDICDTLIYALYPKTGVEFLKWKYGIEPIPDKVKPKTLEDIKKEDESLGKTKEGFKKLA